MAPSLVAERPSAAQAVSGTEALVGRRAAPKAVPKPNTEPATRPSPKAGPDTLQGPKPRQAQTPTSPAVYGGAEANPRLRARLRRIARSSGGPQPDIPSPVAAPNRILPALCYARAADLFEQRRFAAAALLMKLVRDECAFRAVNSVFSANQRAAEELRNRAAQGLDVCLCRMGQGRWVDDRPRAVSAADVVDLVGNAELLDWLPGKTVVRPVWHEDGEPLACPGDVLNLATARVAMEEGLIVLLAAAV